MELRLAQRRGRVSGEALQRHEDAILQLRRDIQRRKILLCDLSEKLALVEAAAKQQALIQLQLANEAAKNELELLRRELCRSLLGISELLRRHQRVAAEKTRVSAELAKLTGHDYAYENYIACAVLHKEDYVGDVQFVVETLKKSRPVA